MGKFKDLTGRVFGRLTVKSRSSAIGAKGQVMWLCKCSCGKSIAVRSDSLNNGHTQSCGCYNRDQSHKALIDLSGKVFGRLTVIELDSLTFNGRSCATWVCKCSCGNSTVVIGGSLKKGNTNSCGCLLAETARITVMARNADYRLVHGLLDPTDVQSARLRHRKMFPKIRARDNNCCVLCKSTNKLQVHHIVPLCYEIVEGANNLITLCEQCHMGKAHDSRNMSKINMNMQQVFLEYISNI